MGKRIAVIYKNGVVAGHLRPAGNAWLHAVEIADLGGGLDLALVKRTDQALVPVGLTDLQSPFAKQLRHSGRSTGTTGRPINGLVTIKHRAATVGRGAGRFVAPDHVMHTTDSVVLWMHWRRKPGPRGTKLEAQG